MQNLKYSFLVATNFQIGSVAGGAKRHGSFKKWLLPAVAFRFEPIMEDSFHNTQTHFQAKQCATWQTRKFYGQYAIQSFPE
ncbi:hypothetical protein ACQP3F_30065, partial [Escherichia coli]